MAERIADALREGCALLIEAATGTGKTFAYLVPALLSGRRVLVSTGTRTLQDQLYHRDLPLLSRAVGRPARVALLKGRANYLCRARWEQWRAGRLAHPPIDRALAEAIEAWSLATRTGDLAELHQIADDDPVRTRITATREQCAGQRCEQYAQCHVLAARRAAQESDIVVVNHHLLLADLALKEEGFGELLPAVDAVIVDEAHQLPDLASESFGIRVSARAVVQCLRALRAALRTEGAIEPARDREAAAALAEQALARLHEALGESREGLPAGAGGSMLWSAAVQADPRLIEEATCIADQLARAGASGEEGGSDPARQALRHALARARELAAQWQTFLAAESGVQTATLHHEGFELSWMPYEIATRFQAMMRRAAGAWILVSATLAVGEDFSHFARRLGLEQAGTLRLDSPFDYARQAALYLPPGMPEPGSPQFGEQLIEQVIPLIEASAGGAFVLFTSHRALRETSRRLRERLAPDYPLFVQGSEPREQLLRQFRASAHAVLLGCASFWEGVDVQGLALRLVIIDKLPFAAPDDAVVRARRSWFESQGLNAFREFQLPEAVLALKQGVGRLIRSETDEGVVVLCDPRLQSRSYGKRFRASLPPMRLVREQSEVIAILKALAARVALDMPHPDAQVHTA